MMNGIRRLLKHVAILFLEATNLVHVDGLELALGFLFVGRKLLFSHGFETDGGIVAYPDDEDAAALAVAVIVVLVGEGDVNLGDVVRRVGRRVRVLEHGLAISADDYDA